MKKVIIMCVLLITTIQYMQAQETNIIISGQSNANGWIMGGFPYNLIAVMWRQGVTSFGSNTHTAPWANGPYNPADTLQYIANVYGAGGNFALGSGGIGLIGMSLANRIDTPSVIINGCASGMGIDFFLKDPTRPLPDLSTQYNATLYRVRAAHKPFKHFVWWQGEADAYQHAQYQGKLQQMITSLKQDIPELEHFYLVQINPVMGCSGNGQDLLRERQRQMDGMNINGVLVHVVAAFGTYQFDGCHLEPEGYIEIGRRLSVMIKHYEDSANPLFIPNVDGIYWVPGVGVKMVFPSPVHEWYFGYPGTALGGVIPVNEELRKYFYLTGGSTNSVDSIEYAYQGDSSVIMLHVSNTNPGIRPQKITYMPDYRYASVNQVYQGPWLFGTLQHMPVPSFVNMTISDLPLSLPILFTEFTAVADELAQEVQLQWGMEVQDSVFEFLVMRSSDASNFQTIAHVDAYDGFPLDYEFVDKAPLRGYNYYKIIARTHDRVVQTPIRSVYLNRVEEYVVRTINTLDYEIVGPPQMNVMIYNHSGDLISRDSGEEIPFSKRDGFDVYILVIIIDDRRSVIRI